MDPYSYLSTQSSTQERSRGDFSSTPTPIRVSSEDCLPSSSETETPAAAPGQRASCPTLPDEDYSSLQKKKRFKSKHSSPQALTPQLKIALHMQTAKNVPPPPHTTTIITDPSQDLGLQYLSQLNDPSLSSQEIERNLEKASNDTPSGRTFGPMSYHTPFFDAVDNNYSSYCNSRHAVPPQPFVIYPDSCSGAGSFNPNIRKQELSFTRHLGPPPRQFCVFHEPFGYAAHRSIVPAQGASSAFYPTDDKRSSTSSNSSATCTTTTKKGDDDFKSNKHFNSYQEKKWNDRLEQFRAFKSKFGHGLVPHNFPENPSLSCWVQHQRRQYTLMLKGKKSSTMTPERLHILNKEGFILSPSNDLWRERYNQLIEYKAKHGHTRVTACDRNEGYEKLFCWVKCQRRQYNRFRNGKPSTMNAERMQLLDNIGFMGEVNKKQRTVPQQPFVIYPDSSGAGSFNSNIRKQKISLTRHLGPLPRPFFVSHESSGYSANGSIMPAQDASSTFYPTHDALTSPDSMLNKKNKTSITSSSGSGSGTPTTTKMGDDDAQPIKRFKLFHEKKWNEYLEQFRAFKSKFGHGLVPHNFPENPNLGCWVKRQRRQYKLMMIGNKSANMTRERADILNKEGFIWDKHDIQWRERYNQLVEHKAKYGHTKVIYPRFDEDRENQQLASWVKFQRRQYKAFWEGKPSTMNAERTQLLEDIGFIWEVKKKKKPTSENQCLAQILGDLY